LDTCSAFGKVLRQKRLAAGLSQEKLGLEANVQRNFVSLIERGVNQPTITVLFKLAKALRCQPSQLLAEVEQMLEQDHQCGD
jgi:transcriptional regulator with XRE-family HTH domain